MGTYLSQRGRELLFRASKGYRAGKIDAGLYSDIASILSDTVEVYNDDIERDLLAAGCEPLTPDEIPPAKLPSAAHLPERPLPDENPPELPDPSDL